MKEIKTSLTEKEKVDFMRLKQIEIMEGFVFDIETPEECWGNTFISKEEVFRKLEKGVQTYFYKENMEQVLTFEEMWEYVEEDYWDKWEISKYEMRPEREYELFDDNVRIELEKIKKNE